MRARHVQCPNCRREIEWEQSPFRPFCSERCRLIDLGAWLTGQHAIPGEPAATQADEAGAPRHESTPQRSS